MSIAKFRRIALSMPEAIEAAHHGHPDFRVKNKVFASLFSRDGEVWGMLKLTPEQQRRLVTNSPDVFSAIKGGWGKRGATQVCLDRADSATLRSAIVTAWRNTALRRLVDDSIFSDTP